MHISSENIPGCKKLAIALFCTLQACVSVILLDNAIKILPAWFLNFAAY
jgi:hypothetical protein